MERRSVVPLASYWIDVIAMRVESRQIRIHVSSETIPNVEIKFLPSGWEIRGSTLPRKTSKLNTMETVPQTDTGGWVEKTKANE
jgi:hypothetical protein